MLWCFSLPWIWHPEVPELECYQSDQNQHWAGSSFSEDACDHLPAPSAPGSEVGQVLTSVPGGSEFLADWVVFLPSFKCLREKILRSWNKSKIGWEYENNISEPRSVPTATQNYSVYIFSKINPGFITNVSFYCGSFFWVALGQIWDEREQGTDVSAVSASGSWKLLSLVAFRAFKPDKHRPFGLGVLTETSGWTPASTSSSSCPSWTWDLK